MPTKDYKPLGKVYIRIKEGNPFKRFFRWLFKKYKWQELKLPIETFNGGLDQ